MNATEKSKIVFNKKKNWCQIQITAKFADYSKDELLNYI